MYAYICPLGMWLACIYIIWAYLIYKSTIYDRYDNKQNVMTLKCFKDHKIISLTYSPISTLFVITITLVGSVPIQWIDWSVMIICDIADDCTSTLKAVLSATLVQSRSEILTEIHATTRTFDSLRIAEKLLIHNIQPTNTTTHPPNQPTNCYHVIFQAN